MDQREADIEEDRDAPHQLRDPARPRMPYYNGAVLSIRRHIPPLPFGTRGYDIGDERRRLYNNTHRPITDYHWCITHPPAETPSHPNSVLHQVQLLDPLASRDGRGTQLFLCRFNGEEKTLVAKIYDGLYYDGGISDLTWVADRDYSHEAAAYQDLCDNEMDGVMVPTYHNSWSFKVWFELGNLRGWRSVRMIIIGYVEGVSMLSLIQNGHVDRMEPQDRLDIFAKVLETNTKMGFNGVDHLDYCPSSIILTGFDTPSPSIVVISMARTAARRRRRARTYALLEQKPVNPIHLFWGGCPYGFENWLPYPHRTSRQIFRDWLESTWSNKTEEFGPPPWTSQVSPAAWGDSIRDPEPIDFYSPAPNEEVEDLELPVRRPDPVDFTSPASGPAAEDMEVDGPDVDAMGMDMVDGDKMEVDDKEPQGVGQECRQDSQQNVHQGEQLKQDAQQDAQQEVPQAVQAEREPEKDDQQAEQRTQDVRRQLQETAQQATQQLEKAEQHVQRVIGRGQENQQIEPTWPVLEGGQEHQQMESSRPVIEVGRDNPQIEPAEQQARRVVEETPENQQEDRQDHHEEVQQGQLETDDKYLPGGDQDGVLEGLQEEQLEQEEQVDYHQLDGDTEEETDYETDEEVQKQEEMEYEPENESEDETDEETEEEEEEEEEADEAEVDEEEDEHTQIKQEQSEVQEQDYGEERILDCIVVQLD